MSNDIPAETRTRVRHRAHHRCERCGVPTPVGHAHHRRSRRVQDRHQHCCCNIVWLCATCHQQVHATPAQSIGWILSQWTKQPELVPLTTSWGPRLHGCDGTYRFTE
jgi:hypothetical protein